MRVLIVGAGSFGVVMAEYLDEFDSSVVTGFLDSRSAPRVLGDPKDVDAIEASGADALLISIGDNAVRKELFNFYISSGVPVIGWIHPAVQVPGSARVGPGCLVLPGCQLMPKCELGRAVFVSTGCGVAHHTKVGDFASLASGARLGAGIQVGERASFGVSSTVMTGVDRVGAAATVGAGAVVIRNVEAGETVVGVPATPIERRTGI